MNNKPAGNYGEDLACEYLKKQGYKILKRNFRIRGGEIDIVAKENGEIIFVEVKTRWSHEFGLPVESVTPWKIKFLLKAAAFYMVKQKLGNAPYRLDVVSVDFSDDSNHPHIELIKNIAG